MARQILILVALLAACGKSTAEKACRGARTSAAAYLDVAGHGLATKLKIPAPVEKLEATPAADPERAELEAAIGEQNRVQVNHVAEYIAAASAFEALREPAKQALEQTAAKLRDDEADAVAAARTALDHLTKLAALDAAIKKHPDVLAAAAALRDRLDARLKQGFKDPEISRGMSLVRDGADLEARELQIMSTSPARYELEQAALSQVIADCAR